jgi:hypothetical protein
VSTTIKLDDIVSPPTDTVPERIEAPKEKSHSATPSFGDYFFAEQDNVRAHRGQCIPQGPQGPQNGHSPPANGHPQTVPNHQDGARAHLAHRQDPAAWIIAHRTRPSHRNRSSSDVAQGPCMKRVISAPASQGKRSHLFRSWDAPRPSPEQNFPSSER